MGHPRKMMLSRTIVLDYDTQRFWPMDSFDVDVRLLTAFLSPFVSNPVHYAVCDTYGT